MIKAFRLCEICQVVQDLKPHPTLKKNVLKDSMQELPSEFKYGI